MPECTRLCAHIHAHTHIHTHTRAHTHAHTHSHRLGLYHLLRLWALISHTVFTKHVNMCKDTLAHCYVNSPYTIFVTNTPTHTHIHTHTHVHTQFFKNLANIFFVVSASCSTCSEFHLLFLTTRCRCSVTVLSTKLLCCNTIPSVHSSSTLNK